MEIAFEQFKQILENPTISVMDTRLPAQWMDGHIPNSLNITPATVKFAVAMVVIAKDTPLVFVFDKTLEKESWAYFKEAGFSNLIGFLKGGFDTWIQNEQVTDMLIQVEPDELAMDIPYDEFLMPLDIREEVNYNAGHIKNSVSLPLSEFMDPGSMSELDEHFNIYVISEDGTNNTLAASILKKQGIHNIRVVMDGWDGIQFLKDKFSFEHIKKAKITKPDSNKTSFLED